jgi:transcriptional regulator with XRE-family HTH domain
MAKQYSDIGDNIKRLRAYRKVTQTQLGNELSLPKQSISRIEKGKRTVSEEELDKMAIFFNFPKDFILNSNFVKSLEPGKIQYFNKWGLELPVQVDDIFLDLEQYFDELVEYRFCDVKTNIKSIENTIKAFRLFLKEYKENNK